MKAQDHISPIEQFVIDYVRKFRLEKGLTQEDIANILEVSRSYIGDIESPNTRAKYNMSHVNILADHFNISPRVFFPEKAIAIKTRKKDKLKLQQNKGTTKKGKVKK
jgi:transcriptional regulator with XRE-family HTH domain